MTFDKYLSYAEESRNYSGAEMLMLSNRLPCKSLPFCITVPIFCRRDLSRSQNCHEDE